MRDGRRRLRVRGLQILIQAHVSWPAPQPKTLVKGPGLAHQALELREPGDAKLPTTVKEAMGFERRIQPEDLAVQGGAILVLAQSACRDLVAAAVVRETLLEKVTHLDFLLSEHLGHLFLSVEARFHRRGVARHKPALGVPFRRVGGGGVNRAKVLRPTERHDVLLSHCSTEEKVSKNIRKIRGSLNICVP